MAKKRTTKKKSKASRSKPAAKKKPSRPPAKKAAKKTAKKKPTPKKVAKKKSAAKKPTAKKKPAAKKTAKPSAKKTTKKTAAPKATETAPPKPGEKGADAKKSGRKGITIVSDKPQRRSRPQPPKASKFPPPGPRLLGPGSKLPKPLIPSGPSARVDTVAEESAAGSRRKKTPFTKRQLDNYRAILITKRAELIGDVTQMESDALRSNTGGLSNTPQHLAEQGSESADQSLSLNLAAADRRLIKEIDAALQRIVDRTFGLCELTGEPIAKERLEELPWARYSIEAARQLEMRGGAP